MLCRCCLNSALPSRNSHYSAFPLLNTSSQRHCLALPTRFKHFFAYAVFTMLFQSKSERCPALPLQVVSLPMLNASALCQRNSYHRSAYALLLFALPLLGAASPYSTNTVMPFDAVAHQRFTLLFHRPVMPCFAHAKPTTPFRRKSTRTMPPLCVLR